MSDDAPEAPKIIVDDDWKSQAQAEKQKLAEQTKAKQAAESGSGAATGATGAGASGRSSGDGGRQLPPASFETLISKMTTQALCAMGVIPDPQTGPRMAHLYLARPHIDMLTVI